MTAIRTQVRIAVTYSKPPPYSSAPGPSPMPQSMPLTSKVQIFSLDSLSSSLPSCKISALFVTPVAEYHTEPVGTYIVAASSIQSYRASSKTGSNPSPTGRESQAFYFQA